MVRRVDGRDRRTATSRCMEEKSRKDQRKIRLGVKKGKRTV